MRFERDQSVGYLVNWAARLLTRLADRRLNPLGLAAGQIPVFIALMTHGPMSQKALAQAAAIEQPTMAATLSRMERDGVIERKPDPQDGRSAIVSLTRRARLNAEDVVEVIESINSAALAGLSKHERQEFLTRLRGMIALLEKTLAANGES